MIQLDATDDEAALGETFASLFRTHSSSQDVRSSERSGRPSTLWAHLVDVGATTMADPEESGGGGASIQHQAVVVREAGRAAAPVSLVEQLVAMPVLARRAPALHAELAAERGSVTLSPTPAVDGAFRFVPGGAAADAVIGVVGDHLVAVRHPVAAPHGPNTASQDLASVVVGDGATILGPAADFDVVLDHWRILTAAALVGIGEAALALGLEYVTTRRQFGVPVGSFQAVQHGLADLPGELAGAWLLVGKAAWARDECREQVLDLARNDITDAAVLASMAYLFCADVAAHVTDRVLHYHGGYGCAEEYDIQLLYRRARGWPRVLGPAQLERRHLADLLLR